MHCFPVNRHPPLCGIQVILTLSFSYIRFDFFLYEIWIILPFLFVISILIFLCGIQINWLCPSLINTRFNFLLYWLYLPHLINGGSGWSVGKETPHWKNTYFVCRFPQNAAAEYRDIWWFNNAGSPKTATVQIEPIISDYVVKDHWYKWYYSWCDRKLLL